jgi:NAD(P)-dependent dehydrogenase (short-subunit alcohol dehydrogenase family)
MVVRTRATSCHGTRVNAIAPRFFETRRSAGLLAQNQERIEGRTPMGRIGRSEEIGGVGAVLTVARLVTCRGPILSVDGGMSV